MQFFARGPRAACCIPVRWGRGRAGSGPDLPLECRKRSRLNTSLRAGIIRHCRRGAARRGGALPLANAPLPPPPLEGRGPRRGPLPSAASRSDAWTQFMLIGAPQWFRSKGRPRKHEGPPLPRPSCLEGPRPSTCLADLGRFGSFSVRFGAFARCSLINCRSVCYSFPRGEIARCRGRLLVPGTQCRRGTLTRPRKTQEPSPAEPCRARSSPAGA